MGMFKKLTKAGVFKKLTKAGVHPDFAKRIIFAAAVRPDEFDQFVTDEKGLCWAPGFEKVSLFGEEYSQAELASGYHYYSKVPFQ